MKREQTSGVEAKIISSMTSLNGMKALRGQLAYSEFLMLFAIKSSLIQNYFFVCMVIIGRH